MPYVFIDCFSNLHIISLRRPDPKTWPASWLGFVVLTRLKEWMDRLLEGLEEEVSFLGFVTGLDLPTD